MAAVYRHPACALSADRLYQRRDAAAGSRTMIAVSGGYGYVAREGLLYAGQSCGTLFRRILNAESLSSEANNEDG